MDVIERQYLDGESTITTCCMCDDEPDNGYLVEKPSSVILHGKVIVSEFAKKLYVCLECLECEAENM